MTGKHDKHGGVSFVSSKIASDAYMRVMYSFSPEMLGHGLSEHMQVMYDTYAQMAERRFELMRCLNR